MFLAEQEQELWPPEPWLQNRGAPHVGELPYLHVMPGNSEDSAWVI